MNWLAFALFTVMCWGFHFNALNQSAKVVSPIFLFWLPIVPLVALLPFYWKTMITDFNAVYYGPTQLKIYIAISMFFSLAGTVSLFRAIQLSGNPTLVGLIEITYPISVALVGYLLFKENHLNLPMVIGGSLIFMGSAIVVYYNG